MSRRRGQGRSLAPDLTALSSFGIALFSGRSLRPASSGNRICRKRIQFDDKIKNLCYLCQRIVRLRPKRQNKELQLFIPNRKIRTFSEVGMDVASPCYVPSGNGRDLQGRGAFLLRGLLIPSVGNVSAPLAFFCICKSVEKTVITGGWHATGGASVRKTDLS